MKMLSRLLVFGLPFVTSVFAEPLRVNALFSDHMVLQRDRGIRVFGVGEDGTEVVVTLDGAEAKTKVVSGRWLAELPARGAGGPYELTVTGGGPAVTKFTDVMVGDVWVGSGQSNMHMRLRFLPEYKSAEGLGNAMVRLFKVAVAPSATPEAEVKQDPKMTAGWTVADAKAAGDVSAVGYYFANAVQRALGVPIGFIHAAQGATRVEAWMDRATLAQVAPEEKPLDVLTNPKNSEVFYNGMIHPLQQYPIKGVIWYQGESSAYDPTKYAERFGAMITQWRAQWGQGDFPFYWVQLASFYHNVDKSNETWAWLREAQGAVRSLPQTGMAVALDLGEYGDIHPKEKKEVGERLARLAVKPEEATGPQYKAVKFEGGKAVVTFDPAGGGLEMREVVMNRKAKFDPDQDPEAYRAPADQLTGFVIAGADEKFYEAEAQVVGDTVVVQSAQVAQPVAVRYGWKNFAVANLFGKNGLPAEPFRTDTFAVPELIKKQAAEMPATFNRFKTNAQPTQAEDPR